MKMSSVPAPVLGVIAMCLLPGCALLSKGEQGAPRFFSLDRASEGAGARSTDSSAAAGDAPTLRLGRVTGASYLEERLVFRSSEHEINYYRERRWSEPPEIFLKQLLTRALFEKRGLRQVAGGPGPTLDIHLTAFDEVLSPQHLACAQAIARLHDDRVVLWEETLIVTRPVVEQRAGDPALAVVDALVETMQALVDQIAERAVRAIKEPR